MRTGFAEWNGGPKVGAFGWPLLAQNLVELNGRRSWGDRIGKSRRDSSVSEKLEIFFPFSFSLLYFLVLCW